MRNVKRVDIVNDTTIKTGDNKGQVNTIFMHFLDLIAVHMIKDDKIFIRGFATINRRTYKPHIVRNPRTGETFQSRPSANVKMKFCNKLKDKINEGLKIKGDMQ